MSDPISRMTVNVGTTTLADIAKTFDGDTNTLYAKKTDEGVVLYSKPGSSTWDKIALTRGPDGTFMSKANAKKMLAQKTVANAIDVAMGGRIHNLGEGTAKLDKDARGTLLTLQSRIQNNSTVGSTFRVTGGSASGLAASLDKLLSRLETIQNSKAARMQVPEPTFASTTTLADGPSTQLKIKGGATTVDAPPLMIGGERYEAEQVLAEATNIVLLYKRVGDGEQPSVVVKLPDPIMDNGEGTAKAALKELVTNKAFAEGKTNVSGFTDGVKLQDGRFALIGQVLPNGDFNQLAQTLDKIALPRDHTGEVPKGMITAEQHDLLVMTAVKDGLTALASIHQGQDGGVHRDVKPQNFMLDGQGVGQLVDFGESVKGDVFRPEVHGYGENALYLSPETNLTQMSNTKLKDEFVKDEKKAFAEAFDTVVKEMFGKDVDGSVMRNQLRGELDKDITAAVKLRVEDSAIGTSMDVWGMGLTLFELATGKQTGVLLGVDFMKNWDVEKKIALLPKTHDRAVTEGGEAKGPRILAEGSGNPAIDKLMNQMLDFDPAKRPGASELLNAEGSPLDGDLVGSDAVRQLMLAVTSGNPDDIDLARGNLPTRVGPPPEVRIEETETKTEDTEVKTEDTAVKTEVRTDSTTQTDSKVEVSDDEGEITETFDEIPPLTESDLKDLGLEQDNRPFINN
jgi:serine/threonine protein kinase